MSLFVQESALSLCLWILGSVAVAIALLLLSVFDGKKDELRERIIYPEGSFTAAIVDAFTEPEERLRKLEGEINTKSNRLEISQEKLEETRRSISELEVTRGEVQLKYQELLRQLKSELTKTEMECQNLHNQIEMITTKRDRLKQELDEVGSGIKVPSISGTDEEAVFKSESSSGDDLRLTSTWRKKSWSSSHEKLTKTMEGVKIGKL